MKRIGLAFCLLITLISSAYGESKPLVQTTKDVYTGTVTTSTRQMDTTVCHRGPAAAANSGPLSWTVNRVQPLGKAPYLELIVQDSGGDPLQVAAGGSMDLLIDGLPIQLISPDGTKTESNKKIDVASQMLFGYQSTYLETISFILSDQIMAQLGSARKVQFRINGARAIERCVDAKHLMPISEMNK